MPISGVFQMCAKRVRIREYFMLTQDRYLVDFTRGEVYELNTIGYEILKFISQGKELEEIVEQIVESYKVPRETVEKDVQKFLEMLEKEDIVEVITDASEDISGN